jgi:pimeloyl-ACP methyl ester carboxylesterase
VLLDQRGTGGSNRLDCQVADRSFVVPRDRERCLAQLSAKADLREYTTSAFIEDIESTRLALGYEQISMYGASYGTRAAFTYARRFPNRVRSLILVAPAPMSMNILDSFEEDGRRAMDALVADCRSDPACSKAFPTLDADVLKVRRELTEAFYAIGLQFLQYSSATSRFIPLLISRAAAGDRTSLDQKINEFRTLLIEWLSLGLHLAVVCNEDVPFRSKPAGPGVNRALRTEYEHACRGWPRVDLPEGFRKESRIDRPALIITGEWDPVTSPRWAQVEAKQFTRSQVVVVPRSGHMIDGLEACIGQLAADFLDHGSTDITCIGRIRRPPYALRLQ